MRSQSALLEKIQVDYEVACERHPFGKLAIDIYRVAQPEALLDEAALAATHTTVPWAPYWAEAWDAAHAMAQQLVHRELQQIELLDLGCGLGITGTVAAAHGARVFFADYAPPALLFAELNCLPWRAACQFQCVDWRHDNLERQFELIVGADILYDRADIPHLDRFWRQHLAPEGKVLLGDPNRPLTNELLEMLRSLGWQLKTTRYPRLAGGRDFRLVQAELPASRRDALPSPDESAKMHS